MPLIACLIQATVHCIHLLLLLHLHRAATKMPNILPQLSRLQSQEAIPCSPSPNCTKGPCLTAPVKSTSCVQSCSAHTTRESRADPAKERMKCTNLLGVTPCKSFESDPPCQTLSPKMNLISCRNFFGSPYSVMDLLLVGLFTTSRLLPWSPLSSYLHMSIQIKQVTMSCHQDMFAPTSSSNQHGSTTVRMACNTSYALNKKFGPLFTAKRLQLLNYNEKVN